ncbi:MAG: ABC transporter substrate-binding protein [Alphaproteobacteria bacterium]
MIARRRFLLTTAGTLMAAPAGASTLIRRVGILGSGTAMEWTPFISAFRDGLASTGNTEGRSFSLHYNWADNHYDRLPGLAADFVRRRVSVITANGGDVAAWAAKRATSQVPIVSTFGADPVASGLVASLNRPGGNVTGVSLLSSELEPKRVELLVQLFPKASQFGLLVNPANPNTDRVVRDALAAAKSFNVSLHVVEFGGGDDLQNAFMRLAAAKAAALLVASDPVAIARHRELVAAAERHAMPAIYYRREFVAAGGLISYGPSFHDAYRLVGEYVGRILNGGAPAEIPVQQSVKIELHVNLRAAKLFGVPIPDPVLLRADEVIE